jgi:hypothetical protein
MKTIGYCVLLASLSAVAYGGLADALSGAGQPLLRTPASPSVAATPLSLNMPVGPLALDASSGRRASGAPGNDAGLAARHSEYVFLHETRNARIPTKAAGLSTCPE